MTSSMFWNVCAVTVILATKTNIHIFQLPTFIGGRIGNWASLISNGRKFKDLLNTWQMCQ